MMFKSVHFTRLTFIAIICSLLGGAVFGQIVRIQTSATHQQLSQWAEKTYGYETKTYYPERGQIYDRWGHLLAGNMIVYEIGVDLQMSATPGRLLRLSPVNWGSTTARYWLLRASSMTQQLHSMLSSLISSVAIRSII